eukprot:2932176-Amphidinium_carterae.1
MVQIDLTHQDAWIQLCDTVCVCENIGWGITSLQGPQSAKGQRVPLTSLQCRRKLCVWAGFHLGAPAHWTRAIINDCRFHQVHIRRPVWHVWVFLRKHDVHEQ